LRGTLANIVDCFKRHEKIEDKWLSLDRMPMTSDLRQALPQWCEERLKQPISDKEHVFLCMETTSFCKEYFGKPFLHRQHLMERLCTKAKVKPFGFHMIRHLTASILYKKGYPLVVIQAILRHSNPNTTARIIRSLGLEKTGGRLKKVSRVPLT
jgi:integrase